MTQLPRKEPVKMSVALASTFTTNLAKQLALTPTQEMRARSNALQLDSKTALAKCDAFSKIRYCFETIRYDFGRDDCIYPVPYGAKVQAQISVRGFKELAMRSGKYKEIDCSLVYECDKIKRNRTTGRIEVEFEEDVSKIDVTKRPTGYYAYATDLNGELVSSVYWTWEQCETHGKTYSKSYNSVWATSFDKMASKTVIKQLCNKLDSSLEMKNLIQHDQIVFGGKDEENSYKDNPNIIDVEVEEKQNIDDVLTNVETGELDVNEKDVF